MVDVVAELPHASLAESRAKQLLAYLRGVAEKVKRKKLLESEWYPDVPCFITQGTPRAMRTATLSSLKILKREKKFTFRTQQDGALSVALL